MQALREASRAQSEQQLKEVPDICLRKFLSTCSDEELRTMRMLASMCGLTYYMGTKVTVRGQSMANACVCGWVAKMHACDVGGRQHTLFNRSSARLIAARGRCSSRAATLLLALQDARAQQPRLTTHTHPTNITTPKQKKQNRRAASRAATSSSSSAPRSPARASRTSTARRRPRRCSR